MGRIDNLLFRFSPRYRQAVVRNLGLPEGRLGRRVGSNLVAANRDINELVVRVLAPVAGEVLLEFGHGPGAAIRLLLDAHPDVRVIGLDPSAEMIDAARAANAEHVRAGRLELHHGRCEDLAIADGSVDAAFGNNVLYFWRDPAVALARLRRVVREGGRLALGYRPRGSAPDAIVAPFEGAGHQLYEVDQVEAMLLAAGFHAPTTTEAASGECVTLAVRAPRPTSPVSPGEDDLEVPTFVVD